MMVENRKGIAGVPITNSSIRDASVVVLRLPEEDFTKQEQTIINPKMLSIELNCYGIFTGALERDEDPRKGLAREIFEEYGAEIRLVSIKNHLPPTEVQQVRDGQTVAFNVINHTVVLSNDNRNDLKEKSIEIPVLELLHWLDQDLIKLRPAARLSLYNAVYYWIKEGLL